MRISIMLIFSFIFGQFAISQVSDDPVLFTVEGVPVNLSEFDYIYSKNSGEDTDYSEKSIREYLDLYVKFKLKVQRAKELQLDTIPSLKKELAGYRKQLAKSYLTDKEVTNRLIEEVYDRSQYDVHISHVLINLSEKATATQEAEAYEKINNIYKEIQEGMSFETAVKKYSQDKISAKNKGSLGYLTSMFPAGFYALENTAYSLKKGEISTPIRTKLGLHLVRLEDKRLARGEMEVSHILIRKKKERKSMDDSKQRIDSIYIELKSGADFASLATAYSEDKASAKNDGYIGYFGINRFEKAFEDAAFSLTKDGSFTEPIESSVGWHIIKRISKKERVNEEDATKQLKPKVLKDPRQKIAVASLIDRIQKESNFTEYKEVLNTFANEQDKTFFSYKWKVPQMEEKVLFSYGDMKITNVDFANYTKENTRLRLRMDDLPIEEAINKMYTEYVEEKAIVYEEKQLEKKYPDFRAIMREYEEGILLFEVTKMNVWDKASQDTVGLKAFYERNKNDYIWKERAQIKTFVVQSKDEKLIKSFIKKAKKKSDDYLKKKFGDIFSTRISTHERGSREVSGIKFKKGAVSSPIIDTKRSSTKFKKIIEVIPPGLKSLSEARGYIEADYQDELEKEWVAKLRKKYEVKIHDDVLQQLIK